MPEFTQDPPAWVRPYLKIPYRDLDCLALAQRILRERAGVELRIGEADIAHSADETLWAHRLQPEVESVVAREKANPEWVRVEGEPRECDVALYRVAGRWHVVTVVGGGWAVNTNLERGSHPAKLRVLERAAVLDSYWRHGSRT